MTRGETRMRSVARNVTGSDSIRAEQTATCGTITVLPADDDEDDDEDDNGVDNGNGVDNDDEDDPDPTEPRELPLGLLAAGGAVVVGGIALRRRRGN